MYNATKEEHIIHLRHVLQVLPENELYINLKKCYLMIGSIFFLHNAITTDDIKVDKEKI